MRSTHLYVYGYSKVRFAWNNLYIKFPNILTLAYHQSNKPSFLLTGFHVTQFREISNKIIGIWIGILKKIIKTKNKNKTVNQPSRLSDSVVEGWQLVTKPHIKLFMLLQQKNNGYKNPRTYRLQRVKQKWNSGLLIHSSRCILDVTQVTPAITYLLPKIFCYRLTSWHLHANQYI